MHHPDNQVRRSMQRMHGRASAVDDRMNIGNRIRKAREDKKLTAKQLGILLGYGKNGEIYVSNWELGKRPVPKKKAPALSKLLNIKLEDLLMS